MKNRRHVALGFLGLAPLALLGCGSDSSQDVGRAADKATATRVVEIRQVDALRFEPASIEVKASETVTLRVTNEGTLIHEFFLGDQKAHDERNAEMQDMGTSPMKMADLANSLNVEPGTTEELTWTFPAEGTVQFGCHQPGHYDDGMKGTAQVS